MSRLLVIGVKKEGESQTIAAHDTGGLHYLLSVILEQR